jgi:hypothetical protein
MNTDMKKQTAVEWLQNELWSNYEFKSSKQKREFISKIEQAKAMEKEQIRDSYIKGYQYRDTFGWEGEVYWEDDYHFPENEQALEDYYRETYGGDK